MKRTKALEKWIEKKVLFYCDVLNVNLPSIAYDVPFGYYEENGHPLSHSEIKVTRYGFYAKDSVIQDEVIWINIPAHKSKKLLERTIVHECCHKVIFEDGFEHEQLWKSLMKEYIK